MITNRDAYDLASLTIISKWILLEWFTETILLSFVRTREAPLLTITIHLLFLGDANGWPFSGLILLQILATFTHGRIDPFP